VGPPPVLTRYEKRNLIAESEKRKKTTQLNITSRRRKVNRQTIREGEEEKRGFFVVESCA